MADLSTQLVQTAPRVVDTHELMAGFQSNAKLDSVLVLGFRLRDAEQLWRYFCRRDEMNAEIHLEDGVTARVRYSPITIAAERLCGWLAQLYYGEPVDYMTQRR
jgi:hypothetical protein